MRNKSEERSALIWINFGTAVWWISPGNPHFLVLDSLKFLSIKHCIMFFKLWKANNSMSMLNLTFRRYMWKTADARELPTLAVFWWPPLFLPLPPSPSQYSSPSSSSHVLIPSISESLLRVFLLSHISPYTICLNFLYILGNAPVYHRHSKIQSLGGLCWYSPPFYSTWVTVQGKDKVI